MIMEGEHFYIDYVTDKDISELTEVYNSNRDFLLNHMDKDHIEKDWMSEELRSMRDSGFTSYKVVDKETSVIIGGIDILLKEEAYLSLLILHNNYKNKGLGKLIYSLMETHAISLGCKCLRIDVVTNYDHKVIDFWMKCGFLPNENIELNWTGKVLPAVVMRKQL